MLTRRGLIAGAGAGALAVLGAASLGPPRVVAEAADSLAGELRDALGLPPPVHRASLVSRARGRLVRWNAVVPPGVERAGLPMVLALHGRGGNAASAFGGIQLDRALAAHVERGGTPFAVVTVDGGDSTYYHPRADGDDPLRMITDELLPAVAEWGLRTDRIATMGWSMGGYGSLMLARESVAGRLGDLEVVAAAASAPALWTEPGLTAPGAFDDPADWQRWGDLIARPGIEGRVPLRVDCGRADEFAAVTRAYRRAVDPAPAGGFVDGGHDANVWRGLLGPQLRFLGRHLADLDGTGG